MEEKKNCFNCKHFVRYYVIIAEFRFRPINDGHCANSKVSRSIRKERLKNKDCCELWRPQELLALRQNYCVEQTLMNINKDVEEILQLIRDR